jgi:hypothetical protein
MPRPVLHGENEVKPKSVDLSSENIQQARGIASDEVAREFEQKTVFLDVFEKR